MRRVSLLMAFLIPGYILGVWSFLLVPKYYLVFGLKGLILSLVPALVALFLMYSEVEATKKTRYLIYELFFKIGKRPGIVFTLFMFLLTMLGISLYYSAYSLPYVFGKTPTATYVAVFELITMAFVLVLLLIAKGRTVDVISFMAILFVLFAIVTPFLVKGQVSGVVTSQAAKTYMEDAVSSITSFDKPLTGLGVFEMMVAVLLSLGLGAGVYYVIGSFSPEDLDFKKVFGVALVLQIILGLAAAYTVAYSLGSAYEGFQRAVQNPDVSPEESMNLFIHFSNLKQYTTNSTQPVLDTIDVFYSIPRVLKGNVPGSSELTFLLMLAVYLAGLTTIIVMVEMGGHIISEVMQINREKGLAVVSTMGFVIGALMIYGGLKTMFLAVPLSVGALIAAVEAYPLLSKEIESNKPITAAAMLFLILVGLGSLYYNITHLGAMGKLGILLGLLFFLPVFMSGMLMKGSR